MSQAVVFGRLSLRVEQLAGLTIDLLTARDADGVGHLSCSHLNRLSLAGRFPAVEEHLGDGLRVEDFTVSIH